ncbi:MAG: BamA/TamA family outer membrane protein [Balneolaceae bacterium]
MNSIYAFQEPVSDERGPTADEETDQVVRRIRFSGNDHVRNRTLRTLIRTRTNREMLGIPRFTPWYYIYQLTGRFGESPSYLDRQTLGNDIERIRLYYENIGFFETGVDTSVIEYREGKAEITFYIDEGPVSKVRSVSYTGLPDLEPAVQEDFYQNSLLGRETMSDTSFTVDREYSALELRAEQSRIIEFLKDHGYAAVQRDSVRALIKPDEAEPQQLDILFQIQANRTYNFGNIYIRLAGPEGNAEYEQVQTLDTPPAVNEGFSIEMEKQESAQTEFSLLTDQILFRPGDTFNNSLYVQSVNEFQNLGMLTIRGFGLSEDGSVQDFSESDIPVYFDLQTLPKHSIRSEFFGMRRYGFGTGVGVNYSNNNLFGRAENLTLGFHTNFELVTSREFTDSATLFSTYQASADYSVPRLNFPFASLDRHPHFTSARTRYQLTYGKSNQPLFDINSDVRFNLRYEVTHSSRLSSFLDLVQLDVVDADPSSEYLNALRDQFRRNPNELDEVVEGRFEFQRILEDFRPQFSSIIRYTIRDQDTNLIKRNYGYFSEYSIAVGGNIPFLFDRFVFSPGEIKGTLPSPLGLSSNSLTYSQFFKVSADYRRYIPIGPETVASFRGFAGFAHPYNKSESVPLSRRFFAGGSNDIRGWGPFRLGPGEVEPDQVAVSGGEIKLAAFAEVRQVMFENMLNADWYLAFFTDTGNVWYGPRNDFTDEENQNILEDGKFFFNRFYRQIAVGSGIGFRLDWDFIVARFDFAFRAHDPRLGWFDNRRAYFSFGIGHSF